MNQVVQAGGLRIGEGMPKICVPLCAGDLPGLVAELAEARAVGADLAEWRADAFAGVNSSAAVLAALDALHEAGAGLPLLFTLRSSGEGGAFGGGAQAAAALLCAVAESGLAALVDAELSLGDSHCAAVVAAARQAGCATVLSSHDFAKTPPEAEMLARLRRMRVLGADLPKLAVMPAAPRDVLALLAVTAAWREETGAPLITMAMGPLGVISRVAGESFGSVLTFGAGRQASAPGQMEVGALRDVLQALHEAMNGDH